MNSSLIAKIKKVISLRTALNTWIAPVTPTLLFKRSKVQMLSGCFLKFYSQNYP